ncbi:MAG: hypothetical protein ABJE95_02950 [Byssovorax sp.]
MNRRIRSAIDRVRRAAPRAGLLCFALGLVTAACSSDLFHDTKWQSRCDTEPDAAICPQGTGGAGGTSATSGSASSASSSASAAQSSSASSTAGAGGAAPTSTGAMMTAGSSSSTGP